MARSFLSTQLHPNEMAKSLASWGLFILFPGFVIYHSLLAIDVIPAFLAGLFGPVSLIYFILFLTFLPFTYKNILKACPIYYMSVMLFFIYCAVWMILHFAFIQEPYVRTASIQTMFTLVIWVALFFIGMHFSFEKLVILYLFAGLFIIIFIGLLYFAVSTGNVMFIASRFFSVSDEVSVASYQGFSRSAFFVLIIFWFFQQENLNGLLFVFALWLLRFLFCQPVLISFPDRGSSRSWISRHLLHGRHGRICKTLH
ncbi:MAG: hypothetical protein BWZ05_02232 [Bacteroidetes bacterium ADurb.BinA245]|nr:MAG: hypothetical protein BWZ05_02232 [Bacteroidetes bacterium ADurb.BinA245]